MQTAMSLVRKTRNDAVKSAVNSYLERRNYPDMDIFNGNIKLSHSAEEMAVATIVQCEASRTNSILFSCINNDPGQYEVQYTRLVNFIKDIKIENVKNELLGLLSPLLCHLYLEMLRGGHGATAQMFFKRHSATLPQKDLSYHQAIDGNLPSALYRPNSLEQLFNSLQNGTIDNEMPEKDYMSQILDDIGSIYTLSDVETKPSIAAFRSCKFDVYLSKDALNLLKGYLAKHGHVLLIQVLQTWFHIDITNDGSKKKSDDDEDDEINEEITISRLSSELKPVKQEINDVFSNCNGHAEDAAVNQNEVRNEIKTEDDVQVVDEELNRELEELRNAIKSVRQCMAPLKLYKVSAPDSYLVCAKTDACCNVLCGGFSDSEIRVWELGQNNIKRRYNRNISEFELACNIPVEPETTPDQNLEVDTGFPLRGHSGPVQAVSVLAREELILSASHDGSMRSWRLSDYSCAAIYRGHNYPIWCMDVSKNGIFIVTGSHDKTAKLWSLDRTFPVRVFIGHMSDVTCVRFHPNDAYVATGGADRTVRMFSVCDARPVRVLNGHRGVVRALAFSPQGTCLATAGDDKRIRVWDLAACTCVHEYKGHHGKVTALDWSAVAKPSLMNKVPLDPNQPSLENSLLCSAGMDGIVKLWDSQATQSSSQEIQNSTYNTKCSYLVDVQVHPEWVVAIGTNR